MKVTVNSTQKTFQVEVEPGQTVGDLKTEINRSEGFPPDRQKLVVGANVLEDNQMLEAVGIEDGNSVTLLVPNSRPRSDYSNGNLVEAGPSHVNNRSLSIPSGHPTSTDSQSQFSSSQTPALPLNQLDSHSQSVSHIFRIEANVDDGRAQALHENPSIRQAIIRDIEQRDPALAQRLTENPGLFDSQIHILPIDCGDSQAVQTLVDLGFSHAQAVEAYLACDKNQELAANFLLNSATASESKIITSQPQSKSNDANTASPSTQLDSSTSSGEFRPPLTATTQSSVVAPTPTSSSSPCISFSEPSDGPIVILDSMALTEDSPQPAPCASKRKRLENIELTEELPDEQKRPQKTIKLNVTADAASAPSTSTSINSTYSNTDNVDGNWKAFFQRRKYTNPLVMEQLSKMGFTHYELKNMKGDSYESISELFQVMLGPQHRAAQVAVLSMAVVRATTDDWKILEGY